MNLYLIAVVLYAFSSVCGAQTAPNFMGTDYTLDRPLTRFPDVVGIGVMLDEDSGAKETPIYLGCQPGQGSIEWTQIKFSTEYECSRQGVRSLRIFVKAEHCNKKPIQVELRPMHVDQAWTKDGHYRGTVTLLLRAQSLNFRNVAKPPKAPPPFSVLNYCA